MNNPMKKILALATLLTTLASSHLLAQKLPDYGPNISLDHAKKVMAAAQAEARTNQWNVVIAIVDAGGHLVLLERMDSTQFGSVEVARQKAWSSAAFRRPTKVFQDILAAGGEGTRILAVQGASPVEGGLPIIVDGKIIGAIGVSGVTSQQDGVIALAGVKALADQKR
jgi:glc operon protein GlcG